MDISVYITSFNQKSHLKEAIESVLAQTFLPFEIWIVDDCSEDGSQEMIRSYQNRHPDLIKTVFHEVNMGVTQSRIDGVAATTGEFVTYLDGDDLYLPGKLEEEIKLMKSGNADLVFSNHCVFEESPENVQWTWVSDVSELPAFGNMYYDIFTRNFPRNTLFRCELVRRNLIERVGSYDPNLNIYEDFEMKIRYGKLSEIAFTLTPLTLYRNNPKGLSKSAQNIHLDSLEYIIRKHLDDLYAKYPDRRSEIDDRVKMITGKFRHQKPSKWKSTLKALFNKANYSGPWHE